jgi:N6-adenosine-specific RNA methylase IME4
VWLDVFKGALQEVQEPGQLSDLHVWLVTLEEAVGRLIRDRKTKLDACQMLAEARLRTERELGAWLSANINHTGGGDRRSVSSGGTPVRDLPEGISRNDSSKFQKIASIPDTHFEHWLVTCRDKGTEITTKGALKRAKALEREQQERPGFRGADEVAQDLNELVVSGRRFGCVYLDPPWEYGNSASNGAAASHYPTLTVEELAALPIKDLAAPAAHCHLWTTTVHLPSALQLLTAWGFEYKSVFVWLKEGLGLGNFWRVATEFLLLGVRGQAPFADHGQPNWLASGRGRHSEKPDAVRGLIELVSPGPYLELFARKEVSGWTTWGNEVGGQIGE